jgi:hypothetical protein
MTRHAPDFVSLIFGLLFVTVGLVLLAGDAGAFSLEWVAPLTAIALGVLLVIAARSSRPAAETDAGEFTPAEASSTEASPTEAEEA